MAERLNEAPKWVSVFLGKTATLTAADLAARVDVVRRIRPGVLACGDVSLFVDNLLGAGLNAEAQEVWHKVCASDTALLYDGSFANFDPMARTRAFDWQLSGRGDIEVGLLDDDAAHRHLALRVNAASTLWVLRRPLCCHRATIACRGLCRTPIQPQRPS
jgi:hypothetical protein